MSPSLDEALLPLRADHRRGRALDVAVRALLSGGLTVVLVWIAKPSWLAVTAAIAGGVIGVAVALVAMRPRFDPVRVDRELGLDERLATWADLRARGRAPASLPWLERELAARLATVPVAARRRLGRRGLGPWRLLVWAILALLLLRALLPVLPDGVLELAGTGAGGAAGAGTGPGEGGGSGARGPADGAPASEGGAPPPSGTAADEPPAAPPEGPPPQPEPAVPEAAPDELPPGDPPPEAPRAPLPPEAVIERPTTEVFAVPTFVGDERGEVREAPVVGLEEVAPPAEAPPPSLPPPATAGADAGATGGDEPLAVPSVDWQRALERALASRHVPLAERPFVRAFFQSLAEAEPSGERRR